MTANPTDTRVRDWSALAFACFFPLVMAFLYFVVLEGTKDLSVRVAFGVGKTIQVLFPAAYVLWYERNLLRFIAPNGNGMLIGAGFGLAVAAAMVALYYFFVQHISSVANDSPRKILAVLQQMKCDSPTGYLLMALFVCGPHALMEEYYWRWFVFGTMRRQTSLGVAIVLSSVGFMLHHIVVLGVYFPGHFWTLALPFSLCVAVGGGMWAWIFERSGTLYAPWLSHALIDAAIMGIGYWMVRGYLT